MKTVGHKILYILKYKMNRKLVITGEFDKTPEISKLVLGTIFNDFLANRPFSKVAIQLFPDNLFDFVKEELDFLVKKAQNKGVTLDGNFCFLIEDNGILDNFTVNIRKNHLMF